MKRLFAVIIILCAGLGVCAAGDGTAAEPFDRGIGKANSLFIPKGTVGGGLSVSYANYQIGNGSDDAGYKMLFSLLDNVHGGMQSFGVAPYVSYFVKDNLSLGLRFDYDKSGFNLDLADVWQEIEGSYSGFYRVKFATLEEAFGNIPVAFDNIYNYLNGKGMYIIEMMEHYKKL